jgi:peptidoglycan/LPS O-acetylase OafA/YrhL
MAFVVCRTLNVWLRAAIFAAVLLSLSVALYHAVEAPMIKAGVKISPKFRSRSLKAWVGLAGGERVAQATSD